MLSALGRALPVPIPVVGDDPANEQPTQDEAGDIGERVPANGQRPPLHENGIDRWKRQNECWHRMHGDALGPNRRQVGALNHALELIDWPEDRTDTAPRVGRRIIWE